MYGNRNQTNPNRIKEENTATVAAPPAGVVNIKYTVIPTEKKQARFVGDKARCGNCGHLLGIFAKADGEIKCFSGGCKTINIIKK